MQHTKARLIPWLQVTLAVSTALPAALPALDAAPLPVHSAKATRPLLSPRDQSALAKTIDRLGDRVIDEAKVNGLAIVIVQDDAVLLERGYGWTDSASKQPVGTDTVFRIASLSKAFAGTLAAMLVEEGALRWDTRLVDHLPAFKLKNLASSQSVTVKDILSHQAGLPHNTHDRLLEADEPYPLLVAKLESVPTICAAGQCYSYQNIAFSLIGDMVFAATGDFYSHQVEKRIFHPLSMYSATFGRDALEASPSWARPHVRNNGRWIPVRPKETYYRIPPAAGVNASIHDLGLWLRAQMGQRPDVISEDVLAGVQSPLVATPTEMRGSPWRRERLADAHYGLGWRVADYSGTPLVFHAGAVQGYRGIIGFLPEHGFGVAMVWNCESGVPMGLLPTALDRYLGLPQRDWLELHKVVPRSRRRR